MMNKNPPRRNVYFNPNRVDQIDLLKWIKAKIDAGLSFSQLAKVALNEKMETELKGLVVHLLPSKRLKVETRYRVDSSK